MTALEKTSLEGSSWPLESLSILMARLARTDLQPSPAVNDLFRQLVEVCMSIREDDMTDELRGFRERVGKLGAAGEANLERHWARAVVEDPSVLARFPFLDAYRYLVSEEIAAVRRRLAQIPRRWMFIGVGPLPLSPLLLEQALPEVEVTYVDRDSEALQWSQRVAVMVNGVRARRFSSRSAVDLDYSVSEVVVVAALVGRTAEDKRDILAAIERTAGRSVLVLARSVPRGGRELLYPRVDVVPEPWRVLDETQPPDEVVNCTLVVGQSAGGPALR